MNEITANIEEKLQELDLQREAFISKMKRVMDNNKIIDLLETEGQLLAYFSYSYNMTTLDERDNFIIGSLTIHNNTSKPVDQLSIGLVIDTENEYQFSGKFETENNQISQSTPINWKRITDGIDNSMYWFKWIGEQPIPPFSTVTFSDFTISWKSNRSFYCSVKGFIYTDKERDGVPVNTNIGVQIS